jgi:hypothetical protein
MIFFISHSNIADRPAIIIVDDANNRRIIFALGIVLIDG